MELSVAIITKNEEKTLEECLKRLSEYPFEIVVVDTGSTDNTIAAARKYTDKVFTFTWNDHFSDARNFSIGMATHDFVLIIDSDEFVTDIDINKLMLEMKRHPDQVGRLHRRNVIAQDKLAENERVSRLFKRSMYCYEGRVHEQVVSINRSAYETYDIPVFVEHGGYMVSFEGREQKADRNIKLLELDLKENGSDPYTLYQLGKSYYFKHDYNKAADYFYEACGFDLNPRVEYVTDMIVTYAYSLLYGERIEEALSMEGVYEEFSYSADYLFVMGLIYMQDTEFDKAINMFLEASRRSTCAVEGVNAELAFHNIGVIYECLGDQEKADYYYQKCNK